MKDAHVFRVAAFDRFMGGHYCTRLAREPEGALGRLERDVARLVRTNLWGTGGNLDPEGGEAGFQRALASRPNAETLNVLAAAPPGTRLLWTAREVGGIGRIDVVALLEGPDGRQTLLLLDMKNTKPAGTAALREQYDQAVRNAHEALQNLSFPPDLDDIRLLLLAGYRSGQRTPEDVTAFPTWLAGTEGKDRTVPCPTPWGVVPIRCRGVASPDDAGDFVILGPWPALDAIPWLARLPSDGGAGGSGVIALTGRPGWDGYDIGLRLDGGPIRLAVRVPASAHRDALRGKGGGQDLAAGLLAAVATSWKQGELASCPGWTFVGATNDKGCVRLHWERTATGPVREDEAIRFAEGLLSDLEEILRASSGKG